MAAKNPGLAAANRTGHKVTPPKEPKPVRESAKKHWSLLKSKPRPTEAPVEKPKTLSPLDTIANDLDAQTQGQDQMQGVPRPAEHAEEPFSLPKIAEGDIVMSKPTEIASVPSPEPLEPSAPIVDAPSVFTAPQPPPAAVFEAGSGPGNEDRAAILARLKERVATHQLENPQQPIVPIQPVEPISTSKMMPRNETPLEVPRIPVPQPPLPPVLPGQETSSPLHTYTSDFADRIDTQHASTFSVLAAEKDAVKPRQVPIAPKKKSPAFAIAMSVVLVLLGAGIAVGAYFYMSKNAPVNIVSGPSSLIATDSKVQLTGTGRTLLSALGAKAAEPLAANNVLLTYVDESTTTSQGVVEQQATGGAFITELNLPAPDILLRNIEPSSMVGIVHAANETRPFFILRVDSYERTFAGMLSWESTIQSSLQVLYPLYPAIAPQTTSATTNTSTSTKIFIPPVITNAPTNQFIDEIVANHSARALKDTSGRTLLIYGYADKQTLVIARDEAAFTILLSRLATNNK